MVRVFGIRNCDSCRAAIRWLQKQSIEHEFIDLRADGLSEDDLARWQQAAGWESLLNKRSLTWRKIPPVDREKLDADRAAALILEYPTVMRRPLLEVDHEILLGFDTEAWAERLGRR